MKMSRTKPRGKYQSVSLPKPFFQLIKTHILKDARYKTVAEYIREAIREKMMNEYANIKPIKIKDSEKSLLLIENEDGNYTLVEKNKYIENLTFEQLREKMVKLDILESKKG